MSKINFKIKLNTKKIFLILYLILFSAIAWSSFYLYNFTYDNVYRTFLPNLVDQKELIIEIENVDASLLEQVKKDIHYKKRGREQVNYSNLFD